jgi:AcrR family transcriptional regulator
MRYDDEHKPRTRQRIVEQAAMLFRREGYGGVGIDRIMAAAGLTRGGFYAHFPSKSALFAEVLRQRPDFARRLQAAPDAAEVIGGYLDPANREKITRGCSLATLTNEVPRRDRAARRAYAEHVAKVVAALEDHVSEGVPDERARALEALALCVGGISLARGLGDGALARELLAVCRERAIDALSGAPPRKEPR